MFPRVCVGVRVRVPAWSTMECASVCVCECDHECDRQKDLSVILTISSFLQRNEVWLAVIFWRALLNQPQLPSHPSSNDTLSHTPLFLFSLQV